MTNLNKTNSHYNGYLTRILQELHQNKSLLEVLDGIESEILQMFSADRLTIYQSELSDGSLVSKYKTGNEVAEIKVNLGVSSISGFVGLSGEPLLIKNVYDSDELLEVDDSLTFNDSYDKKSGFESGSMLVIPINKNDTLLGVMQLINVQGNQSFTSDDLERAAELAIFIGQKFSEIHNTTQSHYEYLTQQDLISSSLLAKLTRRSKNASELGRLIQEQAEVSKEDLGLSLSQYYHVPFLTYEPQKYTLHPIGEAISHNYLKQRKFVFLTKGDNSLIVLIDEPNDLERRQEIQSIIGETECVINVGFIDDIHKYLEDTSLEFNETIKHNKSDNSEDESNGEKGVNTLFLEAIELNAMTVYIEPKSSSDIVQIRMKLAEECKNISGYSLSNIRALMAQIKMLSGIGLDKCNTVQDGKFSVNLAGYSYIVDVTIIPVIWGESIIIRLTKIRQADLLQTMAMSERNETQIKEICTHAQGVFLVLSDTIRETNGTMHSLINYLNSSTKNIWTVENMIEVIQEDLQQVQIESELGLTTKSILQNVLHAKPDIIMIENIEDDGVINTVIEASQHGILILANLKAGSITDAVNQLTSTDESDISDVLLGVLSQRWLKELCSTCKVIRTENPGEVKYLEKLYGDNFTTDLGTVGNFTFYEAKGCTSCSGSGYGGNISINEVVTLTDELRNLIRDKEPLETIYKQVVKAGARTLLQDGIRNTVMGNISSKQLETLLSF